MIHNAQARRIAVIDVPRSALNRLGRIRGTTRQLGTIRNFDWELNPISWTPTTLEPYMPAQPWNADGTPNTDQPTSSAWVAQIVARIAAKRASTPGTVSYTPVPAPPENVARWNSWAGPCAAAQSVASATAAGMPTPNRTVPALITIAAVLGAAASAAYLLNGLSNGRK